MPQKQTQTNPQTRVGQAQTGKETEPQKHTQTNPETTVGQAQTGEYTEQDTGCTLVTKLTIETSQTLRMISQRDQKNELSACHNCLEFVNLRPQKTRSSIG